MNKWVLLLVAGALTLNGCTTLQSKYAAGDHQGIIAEIDAKGGIDKASGVDLFYLCDTLLATRDYKTFFHCAQRLYDVREGEMIITGQYYTYLAFHAQAVTLRAIAHLELGNFQAAYKEALEAYEMTIARSSLDASDYLNIVPISILGISSANLGNREESRKRLAELENYSYFPLRAPSLQPLLFLEKIKVASAMGDYRKVLQIFSSRPNYLLLEYAAGNRKDFNDVYAAMLEARARFETGDMTKAQEEFKLLLSNPVVKRSSGIHYQVLAYQGRITLALGDKEGAIRYLRQAVDLIESQRSTIDTDANKIGFVGDKQAVYADLVAALMDAGRYDEAFAYAERSKSRALVDMLAGKQKFGSGDTMIATEQNKLLAQLDTAETKARVVGSNAESSSTRSITLRALTALTQQAPELSSLVSVAATDVKEIQRLLPKGETLIEYYGSGDNLFAFVVTSAGIRGVKLDGKGLAADVVAFRESILKPQGNAYQGVGNRLFSRLIAPVISGISAKNLTIVAHGALHYLPFSALTSKDGFLIDKYNIRILPSASVMKFLKSNQSKAGSLLALGNPDLGDAKYDLPFAQKEAIKVSNGVVGSKLLLRGDATETAVKNYGNSFRYLHFASHGTFDAEKPLNSGLLLAKDAQNDGMLTVGELYDIKLNADLVTLSACETGLGKVANGDDVVGFTRGFLYAGASSIVSSLWQVDDAATSDLMTGFYANLGTMDKRSALREAQLATKAKYHHPYYWAAFQITGAVQ